MNSIILLYKIHGVSPRGRRVNEYIKQSRYNINIINVFAKVINRLVFQISRLLFCTSTLLYYIILYSYSRAGRMKNPTEKL